MSSSSDKIQQKIVDAYAEPLKKYGPSAQGVGWLDGPESQAKRFEVLLKIGVKSGDSVLDLGCGVGALIDYMDERGLKVNYTGIDIHEAAIKYAKDRHTGHKFVLGDVADWRGEYDWVLASGTFNLHMPEEEMQRILIRAGNMARKGVAANFLHSDITQWEEQYSAYEPKDVIWLVKGDRTILEHARCGLLREFAVYWRK